METAKTVTAEGPCTHPLNARIPDVGDRTQCTHCGSIIWHGDSGHRERFETLLGAACLGKEVIGK